MMAVAVAKMSMQVQKECEDAAAILDSLLRPPQGQGAPFFLLPLLICVIVQVSQGTSLHLVPNEYHEGILFEGVGTVWHRPSLPVNLFLQLSLLFS